MISSGGHRKSIGPTFYDIDIENQFVKWKTVQPPLVYDLSVNPKGRIYWYWTCIVSIACIYNLIFLSLLVFEDIRDGFYTQWIAGNLICDGIYLLDMWFQSRMLFYEHGCKVSSISETRKNYFSTNHFLLDIFSVLPTDLFLLFQHDASVSRLNRLLKCYRLFEMFNLAQGRLKQVIISLLKIVISCTLIFHWNACAFYIISTYSDTESWDGERLEIFGTIKVEFSTFTKAYVLSMYWSALTMTTLGEQILDTVIGMVLFAGIMGSVGDLVAKANKAKADWQQRMDGLKQFMTYRLV
ncbi:unnamed protein product [Nippostrongylus brasiliensis]|uniref:Ion_trans domain-containing protein n=1 Tax=Nippostrongylus brasiliensis TaxID=27835 RepID=A0A0N4XVW8_NIPBR|nr:unnamed protein product [Nippostrongylus brasiliensis]